MASLELTETQLCLPSVEFKSVCHWAWQDTLTQTTIIVLSKTVFSVYLAEASSRAHIPSIISPSSLGAVTRVQALSFTDVLLFAYSRHP